jgi:uncharacterized SAM-binding protein YcdF (DUF218 family)
MFFIASKIGWLLFQPSTFLIASMLIGLCLLVTSYAALGRRLFRIAGGALAICALTPVGVLLIRPLEDRFPEPPVDQILDPAGVIALGGALDGALTRARGPIALTNAGARATEALALGYHFPGARLVFTGGSGDPAGQGVPEGDLAAEFFSKLGFPPDRTTIERKSRSTFENAIFTRELVKPKPGQRWILVTSAFHMPRAVGVFEKAGFDLTPFPVAYFTSGNSSDYWNCTFAPITALSLVDIAAKEWIGLTVYWLTGRSDSFFPRPKR